MRDPIPTGQAVLVSGAAHLATVVRDGILKARISIDIMTAAFKAMLIPMPPRRTAHSSVHHLLRQKDTGFKTHGRNADTAPAATLAEKKDARPANMKNRGWPRLR